MKNLILFFSISILSISTLLAKAITGKVTDKEGMPLPGVNILIKSTNIASQTDFDGKYTIEAKTGDILIFSYVGFTTQTVKVKKHNIINIKMTANSQLDEVVVSALGTHRVQNELIRSKQVITSQPINKESYKEIEENTFKMVKSSPLSTFSIDVDKAGYSNVRRMINNGQEIPKDAVKIEEMINYFDYNYPQPKGKNPFAIHTEVNTTPWNKKSKLIKIGLQGKTVPLDDIPPSNLVFLIDVSGSMNSQNKLPLLKSAFKLLVNQLRDEDKISIVTYAGAAGLVLPPTSGDNKNKILEALNNLNAGGSTAGGQGIELAYKTAEENFIKNGNNRVILATDGDFNVGASSDQAMEELIEEKRKSGVFLTCLGFGTGNYQDSKMETLADKGNGNHAYIDSMQEAQRILGTEFGGTLFTIAKDVKIQVEFNPEFVQAYRLIGYENRLLNDEDFNDDKKDAGELGSGHKVTALYEIIPTGVKSKWLKDIDDLKYSDKPSANNQKDLLTVKFRYKEPDGDKSKLIEHIISAKEMKNNNASADFKFASAVAMFGMKLRKSEYIEESSFQNIIQLAEEGKAKDDEGYKAEFIRLVKASK
ncbi:Ca-activated chloride channel family protein [Mesonia algae]|uniref:Ca-activated chloride channel family protein n=1 Tax=Mesonia algae TaxID=213248 RepID=A0A2W7I2T8_9FLAO|nr:VWA domain-containing protein [Mesonia algae]PZW39585.1 Ca-activated chloride channel family protein [Mesonia algae]